MNARTLLDATREQARRSGVEFVEARAERIERDDDAFRVDAAPDRTFDFVVAASWPDLSYLDEFSEAARPTNHPRAETDE